MSDERILNNIGSGIKNDAFRSEDGTAGIAQALDALKTKGGKVYLPAGEYEITKTVELNTPSTKIEGEVWAYNLDPNGVFETPFGTKLRLKGHDFPAISVGANGVAAGAIVSNIGIQGDIKGMDTRQLLDVNNISSSAGLYFGNKRIDQGEFSKISCCGLAVAICASEDAEIDACNFEKVNMDGCCIGVYFAPRATYHAHFRRCILADTPSYGVFFDASPKEGKSGKIHNVDIVDSNFVRNCGSSPIQDEEPAAVYFKNVSCCEFRDNLVDFPGVFWYYDDDATSNEKRQVQKNTAIGLRVVGNQNRILGNTFSHSTRESILIEGNGNILMTNIVDGDVIINGEGNVVNGLGFTTPTARLILKDKAKDTTVILGVEESRIVRE